MKQRNQEPSQTSVSGTSIPLCSRLHRFGWGQFLRLDSYDKKSGKDQDTAAGQERSSRVIPRGIKLQQVKCDERSDESAETPGGSNEAKDASLRMFVATPGSESIHCRRDEAVTNGNTGTNEK